MSDCGLNMRLWQDSKVLCAEGLESSFVDIQICGSLIPHLKGG